jgi:hypothetical protein
MVKTTYNISSVELLTDMEWKYIETLSIMQVD